MANRPALDLRWSEALVLAIGIVLGLGAIEVAHPLPSYIFVGAYKTSPPTSSALQDLMRWDLPPLPLHLAAIGLTPPTLVVAALPLLRRGAERRRARRLPGVVACQAVGVVLLLEGMIYPLYQYLLLYAELDRCQGNAASNLVQLPKFRWGAPGGVSWVLAGVTFYFGGHVGFAAVGVWLARWVAGLPAAPPSALNRLGMALGATWIAITLGFALLPLG